ncbi:MULTISPECIES: ABC transporter ATP-binding protein [Pseudomonas]|uniref:ABC transporter n=1 Tax=Pseudomonas syringae pv. syringae (strain B728a) TaxID=205918 RepID=Q4ZT55_PSEU2|nr:MULTISPECIES: ATP-binding cassette domain-containing protein [Pseudomonas]AAY37667.1 ABC transporter [Pseudomonas syringae pv. syringae B728a]MCF4986187.1 ATP-binding cassette domain-containing protein [Pseudomonas syringae]MCF5198588.1 ATP-binding cassette domain-containing protein [Pseudomonas syringae]MCF5205192.1 ATP-binding cassette domain-containing protein [Pseudomonas syringae]MCF5208258.1 ATP-binding cassette domain-containing protein [Pseudomonas syringae]
MLQIKGLNVQRGSGVQAHRVQLPELSLTRGQVVAITGESGCGKSTLLEALGLLLAPESVAHYCLDGMDIAALLKADDQPALADVRARSLGFVLQSGGLLPFLNARDNINLPRRLLGLASKSDHVERAIAALHLETLLDQFPQALSIGERQRVACVRAIAHQPRLILADEPTAALDPHNARQLFELLLGLVAELGLSALIVSHDWQLVNSFGITRLNAVSLPGVTRFETSL